MKSATTASADRCRASSCASRTAARSLIRGRCVPGLFREPEATARALRDGWLHTGDHGLLDEHGHLIVVDRLNDLMRLQDGTPLAPQYLENKLKFSPYIKEVVVFANDRPFVAALLNIDFDVFAKWAERKGLPFTTYVDLSQRPEIARLCVSEVEQANADLPRNLRIRRFVVLYKNSIPTTTRSRGPARSAAPPSISATPE